MTLKSRIRALVAGVSFLAGAWITSRSIGNDERMQDCLTAFDRTTGCAYTLRDDKYGEGCRILQPEEIPTCINVGFRLCEKLAAPWSK